MKIWIHINGAQEGPYTLEELPVERMTVDTPVWYQGLAEWKKAGETPVTAPLFGITLEQTSNVENETSAEAARNEVSAERESVNRIANQAQQRNAVAAQSQAPKCPPTFFVWSIVLTIVFCNPIGIVPIVTGFYTRSRWRNQNYAGARKLSITTEWWVMITIVTCLMLAPLSMVI